MKILIINTNNAAGGASKACYRYHMSLLKHGISSRLLINDHVPDGIADAGYFYEWYEQWLAQRSVSQKIWGKIKEWTGDGIYSRFLKDLKFQEQLLREREPGLEVFTFHNSVFDITQHPWYVEADIVHLHFVADHFFDFHMFAKIDKPIVWTLHDMNPFTGGCHYSEGCMRFKGNCAPCPQLKGTSDPNYAGKMFSRHLRIMQSIPQKRLAVAAPSAWLYHLSSSSKILSKFQHHQIPYGLDANVFTLLNREQIREELGISKHKKVLLFAAYHLANKRKGFDILLSALDMLPSSDDLVLLTVGADNVAFSQGIEVIELGMIRSEVRMSELYNAADVFIIPSLEDNLPNTVLESLMCGTPVIGFPVGGIPDMIRHGDNGLITTETQAASLANSITRFLMESLKWDRETIATNATDIYKEENQIHAYMDVYRKMMNEHG